jgi:hypothetical protein
MTKTPGLRVETVTEKVACVIEATVRNSPLLPGNLPKAIAISPELGTRAPIFLQQSLVRAPLRPLVCQSLAYARDYLDPSMRPQIL